MTGEIILAFFAGLVTILNPCVLPVVPILVASALGQHSLGPVALAAGLGVSFTSFGFVVVAFGFQLGIDEYLVRMLAGGLLIAAGFLLLVPAAQGMVTVAAGPLTNRASNALARVKGDGLQGQFLIGLLLGLVWAPCVGPTLGAAIAAASQGESLLSAFSIFLVFAIGVGVSITLFAYGSRKALGGRAGFIKALARYGKPFFGATLLLVGLLVLTGLDKTMEAAALEIMPDWLVTLTTRF